MNEFTIALLIAGVGFGYVFFFLISLILVLVLSSYLFGRFMESEKDLQEAAMLAAQEHHRKRSN